MPQVPREADGLGAEPFAIPDAEKVRPAGLWSAGDAADIWRRWWCWGRAPGLLLPLRTCHTSRGADGHAPAGLLSCLPVAAELPSPRPLPSPPKQDQVKTHITDLMLSAPPRVRAQLSEALSIISSHDFPARWQVRCAGRALDQGGSAPR